MTGEALEVDSSDVDITGSMAETLAEIQNDDNEDLEVAENADEPKPDTQGGDSEETGSDEKPDADKRERDESGKFKAAEESIAEPAPIVEESSEEKELPEIDPKLARAPTTWRNDAKAKWNTIAPEIREEILKREEDIGRGISTYKADADFGKSVQQSLTPYMAMINASGATPNQAVTSMLDTYYKLQSGTPQDKANLLLQAAQQYGADMSVLTAEIDPAQNTMQQQLYPLTQKIQSLEQQISQQNNQAQQLGSSQATSSIEAFRNATDEAGQSLYPHFEGLREHMADLIDRAESIGQTKSLEEAYEDAEWASPDLRALKLTKQSTTSEEQRQKATAEKALKAKKAAGINLQQKGGYDPKPSTPTGTIVDTMAETMAEMRARS